MLNPLAEDELHRFLQRFCAAWRSYQMQPLREIKRRIGNQLSLELPTPD
jgi:hypothetical protein